MSRRSALEAKPKPQVVTPKTRVAPRIVEDALRSPGQPLDHATRRFLESNFQQDFSRVRVHTDSRAAQSALYIHARAYTVGRDVVFGEGQYSPGTSTGRGLLIHELTHVAQQGSPASPVEKHIGPAESGHEREATRAEHCQGSEVPLPFNNDREMSGSLLPGRTIQRSLLGGILGGVAGAAGGALVGGLLGGPIGAVIGGVVGLVGGALLGDTATSRRRSLTSAEIAYAKEIFKDSIDYSVITITRGSMFSSVSPVTIKNTIHMKADYGKGVFVGDTLDLTPFGKEVLIHEMGHVWQYQNGGLAYIPASLIAQLKGALSTGSRNAAYQWREAHSAGRPWEEWNPEQQASAIEEYNTLLRKQKEGKADLDELSTLSTLLSYMDKVWRREGAPTFSRRQGTAPVGRPAAGTRGAGT